MGPDGRRHKNTTQICENRDVGSSTSKALICLVALTMALPFASGSMDMLLSTNEPLRFAGNMTLVIEDVDPEAGKVWIDLLGDDDDVLKNDILGVGGRFTYYGVTRIDLTVTRIYVGGDDDLVELHLIEGLLLDAKAREDKVPAQAGSPPVPMKSPGFEAGGIVPALALLWMLMENNE